MIAWRWFWTLWLMVAGIAFAWITVIVTSRGVKDLSDMVKALKRQSDAGRKAP